MEVQSCSKEIEAGASLENCRRLINQINTWLSAEEPLCQCPHHAPPNITNGAARASLVLFVQAVGASNVVYLALYRSRLCRHLRRRFPSPTYGEAAMTGKHTALEAISASLRDFSPR